MKKHILLISFLSILIPILAYGQIHISKTSEQTIFVGPEQINVKDINVCKDYTLKLERHIATLELQTGDINQTISSFDGQAKLNRKDKKVLSRAQKKASTIERERKSIQVLLANWTTVLKQEELKLEFAGIVNEPNNIQYEISTNLGIYSPAEYTVQVGQTSSMISVTESIPVFYSPKKTKTTTKVVTQSCSSSSCSSSSASSSTVVKETKTTPASVYFKQSNGLAYAAEGCPVGFEYNKNTSSCDRQYFIIPVDSKPSQSVNIVRTSSQQSLELLDWTELENTQIAKSK